MKVEDLFQFKRVSEPSISPDGKWIAYQQTTIDLDNNASSSAIYIVPVDGSSAPRAITTSGKKDGRPRFAPDSRSIVFQSNRSGSMQLWIIDIHGGEARQLTNLATEATNAVWSQDGLKLAFVSAVLPQFSDKPFAESDQANREAAAAMEKSPTKARTFDRLFYRHWDSYVEGKRQHLFVLKLKQSSSGLEADGEPHDATPGDRDAYPTSSTFASAEDFVFSADSSHLIFTAVPDKNEAWSTNYDLCRVSVENRDAAWEALTQANPAADGGPKISPDGKWLAWRSQAKPGCEADAWCLSTCPLSNEGKLGPIHVFCPDRSGPSSIGDFVWKDNETIETTMDDSGSQGLFRLRATDGRREKGFALDTKLPVEGQIMGPVAVSSATAFTLARMNQPAEVFVFRGNGTSMNLSKANEKLLEQLYLPRPESIDTIPIEGNRKLQMWLLKPPGFDPSKKYPCVYLVHGGPQGVWEDGWSFRWCPQLWAAQGYVVAMPNPRGSTGFGQQFVEEISGDWGGRCYRDLMAGADYVESLPFIDKSRIAAAGASFGGYMMNWFAVNTNRFTCLITHCSVWNFESMWGTTDELWFDEFEHGGLPWEKPEKYREFSPHVKAGNLAKFKTPMLVIHNDLDFRCPIGQGHELFTALQRQGVPSRFVNFPDEGHWVTKPANSRLWHNEVFSWLKKYNG
jgi:dipeptidyl aminopeptidase/acylaminoacyl peptidase